MKYIFILGGILAIIIAVTFFWLFTTPQNSTNQPANDNSTIAEQGEAQTTDEIVPRRGLGTIMDIQKLGKNLECYVSYQLEGDSPTEGSLFIADKQIRADFIMSTDDLGEFTTSMIQSDGVMYTWSDIQGESYGMKTTVNEVEKAPEAVATGLIPTDEKVNYDCKTWPNVDKSLFTPPSTIKFQDFEQMGKPIVEYGTIYEEDSN